MILFRLPKGQNGILTKFRFVWFAKLHTAQADWVFRLRRVRLGTRPRVCHHLIFPYNIQS
ncbi:hypothetical protein EII21_10610 [Conchiformibius steedae]|uniref:Uncharacterized protein n=1 Tax=Conchiformibius steedae TaxID=153493 RepID=A0A3P2A5C3_9NEIS|nr:hypothetical protein EII21_10610 [Conchiformibius steedae]